MFWKKFKLYKIYARICSLTLLVNFLQLFWHNGHKNGYFCCWMISWFAWRWQSWCSLPPPAPSGCPPAPPPPTAPWTATRWNTCKIIGRIHSTPRWSIQYTRQSRPIFSITLVSLVSRPMFFWSTLRWHIHRGVDYEYKYVSPQYLKNLNNFGVTSNSTKTKKLGRKSHEKFHFKKWGNTPQYGTSSYI